MAAAQSSPSYSGNENPNGMAVPRAMQAVVDAQLDAIAHAFSDVLSLNASVAEHQDAWLHRLLRQALPFAHEVEKFAAILVACALSAGWPERRIASSMGRSLSDLPHWKTPDAQAAAAAVTEQELDA
ncbi:hypothetical protein [Streptomyces longwoodensis]|uniref:hypothetical protein n=1 Tax=Streptomyces longwoodensis TaxID=68231 RepID=UPI00340DDCBE